MGDAKILFDWRNDPLTRENSHNTDEVPWENHVAWLEKSLVSPTRTLYIAEAEGVPVGTVRADLHNGARELSWTVAPEARGKGFGKAMVLQFVREILPGVRLIASVKKGNRASESIARALGLSPGEQEFPDDTSPNPAILWQ